MHYADVDPRRWLVVTHRGGGGGGRGGALCGCGPAAVAGGRSPTAAAEEEGGAVQPHTMRLWTRGSGSWFLAAAAAVHRHTMRRGGGRW